METNKKNKSFVINTSESKYIKYLLQHIIEQNQRLGWKETLYKDKGHLQWVMSQSEDEYMLNIIKDKDKIINRMPGIFGLVYKDNYQLIINIGKLINREFVNFVPEQFVLPKEQHLFKEFQKNHKKMIFIAKPSASSEGNGILLFKELTEIPQQMVSQDFVIQRYVDKPLLQKGLKFDFRIYILIMGSNPMNAFICREGLVRFCTEDYQQPTKENFKNFFMHLTNYSINKHSENYTESDNIMEANEAHKRTLTSLFTSLRQQGVDIEKISSNIKQTCVKALQIYAPIFEQYYYIASNGKDYQGKFFQILGFDLLVDENLDVFLLEINDHPSLNIYLEKDFMGGGMGKTLSQIDVHVKSIVVTDAIKLAKKSQDFIDSTQNYKSYERIYPEEGEVSSYINKVRNLYNHIASIKQKQQIFSSNFTTLQSKSKLLKDLKYSSNELNLIFQKACSGEKATDFLNFFNLLEKLQANITEKKGIQFNSFGEFIDQLIN